MCTIKLEGHSKDLVLHFDKVGELMRDRFCNIKKQGRGSCNKGPQLDSTRDVTADGWRLRP